MNMLRKSCGRYERPTIRAFFVELIVHALERRKAPVDRLLRRHGLARADLDSPYAWLPLRSYIALMEDAAAETGNDFMGLDLGRQFRQQMLGPFCALTLGAGSLREVLELFETFQTAWQANTNFIVQRDAKATTYLYAIEDPTIWPRRQDAEFTIAATVSLIRQLGASKWTPAVVEFEHSVRSRERALEEFFRAPVYGSVEFNRLTILNEDLDRPLPGGGRDLDGVIRTTARHLKDLMVTDREEHVSATDATMSCIARRLGYTLVDIGVVAKELNLSTRSLRRKLEEEGTSYREVLQEQRRLKAENLLSSRGLHVSELAGRLGYSDSAVFSRAFKNWTGVSPMEYSRRSEADRSPRG
ncbi:MAG: AraC family transcriptional regulator [Rhizobiales bacterium]|nr:AraC family transcriptional regulator [Hyphomicrobiales bacterium]